jgi:hypothetical protein
LRGSLEIPAQRVKNHQSAGGSRRRARPEKSRDSLDLRFRESRDSPRHIRQGVARLQSVKLQALSRSRWHGLWGGGALASAGGVRASRTSEALTNPHRRRDGPGTWRCAGSLPRWIRAPWRAAIRTALRSWEIPVDILAIQAPNECDLVLGRG